MFKTTVHCDVCGKELPIILKHTPLGDVDVIKTARTKQWNTSMILPHLCETCALKIDNELLQTKIDLMKGVKQNAR